MLGREAMSALEKLTTSPAWGTITAVMKGRLADALASGDTLAIVNLSARIAAAQAAQSSEDEESAPYKQAMAERQ